MEPDVRIRLTGGFAIQVDGARADDGALGPLGKVALAYLVVERSRLVSRDELAEVIWGDRPPPTWPSALRGVVSRVRAVLDKAGLPGADTLTSVSGCYQLRLPPDAVVDAEDATAALAAARMALSAGRAPQAVEAARDAVSLSAGHFLAGAGGHWVERRQSAQAELRLQALEVLSEAAAASGHVALAAEAAQEAIALQPFRESAHLRLIDAYAAAGNRAEALRAYERCRRALAEELGVDPSPTTEAAYLRLLGDDPVTPPAGEGGAGPRLPSSITSFVGRDLAIAEIRKSLRSTRLLSLVGVGGVGKSRLALQAAGDVSGDYAEGAWLVELAGLGDPGLVVPQVLSVLGVPEVRTEPATESLARHLGSRRLLLVLDNCEHLIGACAELADALLRRCPGLHILTTSREPLGVRGETIWPVPPLTAPGRGHTGPAAELLDYEAVRLFVDRAGAVAPDLGLDDGTMAHVADIAQQLDGIPLAIELAAAWAKVLSVADIAQRLDDRFRLLVGGPRTAPARHQTLRAALDWSYESLPPPEAAVLRRLSVFAGGFTLAAGEAVCQPADVDVLRVLSGLVDKSLVLVDRSREPTRYRQLETVRQYAAARLAECDEEVECRECHLRWATELAESAEAGFQHADQAGWLRILDDDHDNLRAALEWAASGSSVPSLGARLASSLWRFWEIRGALSEGRAHLSAWTGREGLPPSLRAKVLNSAGVLAERQQDYPAARSLYEECLVIRRSLDERLGTASALHGLANVAYMENDLESARSHFQENLALARQLEVGAMVAASLQNLGVIEHTLFMRNRALKDEAGPRGLDYITGSLAEYEKLGDRHGMALALENLGTISGWLDQPQEARAYQERSLAIRRELGDKPGIAVSARILSRLALRNGDCGTARGLSEECLAIERELGKPSDEAEALAFLAEVAMVEREYGEARSLFEESIALKRQAGDKPVPPWLLNAMAEVATRQRDFETARSVLEELAGNARRLEHPAILAGALARLSLVALAERHIDQASAYAAEVLTDDQARQRIWILSLLSEAMAGTAVEVGDREAAAQLLGASSALRRQFEPPAEQPHSIADHERTLTTARQDLGDVAFSTAWEAGAALGLEVAELLDRVTSACPGQERAPGG